MVLGDLDSYMQNNETQLTTYIIHKNKLKKVLLKEGRFKPKYVSNYIQCRLITCAS